MHGIKHPTSEEPRNVDPDTQSKLHCTCNEIGRDEDEHLWTSHRLVTHHTHTLAPPLRVRKGVSQNRRPLFGWFQGETQKNTYHFWGGSLHFEAKPKRHQGSTSANLGSACPKPKPSSRWAREAHAPWQRSLALWRRPSRRCTRRGWTGSTPSLA